MRFELQQGGAWPMRVLAPVASFATTLMLALAGPRLPGPWSSLVGTPWVGLLGGWLALQMGMIAYLLASTGRSGRTGPVDSLAASLIAATVLPDTGAAALVVPVLLGARAPRQSRVAAPAYLLAAMAVLASNATLGSLAQLAMLAAVARLLTRTDMRAANDNTPLLSERVNWWFRELPATSPRPASRFARATMA